MTTVESSSNESETKRAPESAPATATPNDIARLQRAPQEEALAAHEKYQVQLADWSGPYDVILQVIEERELNLLDLDISSLLEGYMGYLQSSPSINLDEAGEFLVVAATLAQIKSKLLLPKEEVPAEEEEKDPREDLVRYLLEYQKIKQAADLLRERPILGRDVFLKGNRETFEGLEGEGRGNLFQLVRGFQKIMRSAKSDVTMAFRLEEVNVSERLRDIFEGLKQNRELGFTDIVGEGRSKTYVIVTFLAVLELVRLKKVKLFTNIKQLIKKSGLKDELNEDLEASSEEIPSESSSLEDDEGPEVFLRYVEGATEEDLVHSEFDAEKENESAAETTTSGNAEETAAPAQAV